MHRRQPDALPELIHGVDVIHPVGIDGAQQHNPLNLAHVRMRGGNLGFLFGIGLFGILVDALLHLWQAEGIHLLGGKQRLPRPEAQIAHIVA